MFSISSSYDSALAETAGGLYKTELICSRTWRSCTEVKWATLNWVYWWNNTRLHEALGYTTPEEIITSYNKHQTSELTLPRIRSRTKPRILLYLSRGCVVRVLSVEGAVDVASDIAFDAAPDFTVSFSLFSSSRDVCFCFFVVGHLHNGNHVYRAIEFPVSSTVEPVSDHIS